MSCATTDNPIADAIKERGRLYLIVFRELSRRFGREEAIAIMRTVSREQGTQLGRQLVNFAPRDFEGLAKAFAMSPDNGSVFQPDIRRLDDTGLEVKMMSCPVKQAWVEAGCSDEEICTLLHCASALDEATLETAGFDYEIELWSPGKTGCCLTKITEKQ